MSFKLTGVVLFCTTVLGESSNTTASVWNPFQALNSAFKEQGYSDEQVAIIRKHLLNDKLQKNKWPFSDRGKELSMSVANSKNHHSDEIIEAINKAGGSPNKILELGDSVHEQILHALEDPSADSSLLQTAAASGNIADLSDSVRMMAGRVSDNRGMFEELWHQANTHNAIVAKLGENLAASNVHAFVAPTNHLAAVLGLNPGTLASMSLAGSFVGPMLGITALVYAAWPREETDPWLHVESHVQKMLTDKFDAKRRKRLADRQRRYVKQFSRCAKAWISMTMAEFEGQTAVPVPKFIADAAKQAKETGTADFDAMMEEHLTKGETGGKWGFKVPRCMAQLEGHMSLERDEWFGTETGSFSGLFMPFANMHTQVLSLLADAPMTGDPHNRWADQSKMNWAAALRATSAEYGSYLVDHIEQAWKKEVCRSMRLRHSSKGAYWAYQFVVYREVHQPHAAEDCSSKCDGQAGWCDFCGGRFNGACCQKGQGGVCATFDPPAKWSSFGGENQYMSCIHTECIQRNTQYHNADGSKKLKTLQIEDAEECREECDAVIGAKFFSFTPAKDNECICWAEAGTKRWQKAGAFSGPVKCPEEGSLAEYEDELAKKMVVVNRVPIEEHQPCEKSPAESNYEQVEKKHPDWVKTCYKQAVTALIPEFNQFYGRFAKFVDSLAWKSGCAAQHTLDWSKHGEGLGFLAVSPEVDGHFDSGSFSQCNWAAEAKADSHQQWVFDESQTRGWTSSSRVNLEEQHTAKMEYPMPQWLHDLRRMRECLKSTAASQSTHPDDDQSAAVNSIMDPIAPDSSFPEDYNM